MDMDVTIVTKAEIGVDKVQLSCAGIPSGTKRSGTYYEPFSLYGIVGGSKDFTLESSSGLMDFDCSMDSLSQELKVTITRYDSEGEKKFSTIKKENIVINIVMTFFVSCYNEKPEIRLVSCNIS